jgi:hypothetical protein
MVEAVKSNPFIPIAWQKNHSGMQGTEYISKEIYFNLEEFTTIMSHTLNSMLDKNSKEGWNLTLSRSSRVLHFKVAESSIKRHE